MLSHSMSIVPIATHGRMSKGLFSEIHIQEESAKTFDGNKVIKAINKNGVLRNLSILGGEPLCGLNIRFINKLIATIKQKYPSIKVWVWTGYLYEDIEKSLSDGIDVLIDGRFEIDKKDITLPYRGSSNQRVIDVKKTVDNDKIVLWSNK